MGVLDGMIPPSVEPLEGMTLSCQSVSTLEGGSNKGREGMMGCLNMAIMEKQHGAA